MSISYELAGPGSRLTAALLDNLLIALIIAAVVLLAMAVRAQLPQASAPLVAVTVVVGGPLLLLTLYFAIFEALWAGQTPGKRAAGLRVMRDDGTPATTLDIIIRNTVRIVDFLPYFYFVGGLVAFVHKESKRLGDLAAGTVVVKLRETALPEAAEAPSAPLGMADDLAALVRPAVAALSDEQRDTISRFVERRYELDPNVRAEMAQRIVEAIRPDLPADAAALATEDAEALLVGLAQACSQLGRRF